METLRNVMESYWSIMGRYGALWKHNRT